MFPFRSLCLFHLAAYGGLWRVEAQTGHPFPTPKMTKLMKGRAGQSCDEVCTIRSHGTFGCTSTLWPNSSTMMQALMDEMKDTSCSEIRGDRKSESPALYPEAGNTCYWNTPESDNSSLRCKQKSPGAVRFCACWPVQHLPGFWKTTTTTTSPAHGAGGYEKRVRDLEKEVGTLRSEVGRLKAFIEGLTPSPSPTPEPLSRRRRRSPRRRRRKST